MSQPIDTISDRDRINLIVLDPDHFHAALLQKTMYAGVWDTVKVYAPDGPGLHDYLRLVEKYNTRSEDPTHWTERVYTGADYLQKMSGEAKGSVVIISGNNKNKAKYILESLKAGFNVLADKPLAINVNDYQMLKEAFHYAQGHDLLLYDVMTERYSVINSLQRLLIKNAEVFGSLKKGSFSHPAIRVKSVHTFYKEVSGAPLVRPPWFFDVHQQGDGLVDVSTHLVDVINWLCFPKSFIDTDTDIAIHSAKRWPTAINAAEFEKVTGIGHFPAYLEDAVKDGVLQVYANGSMSYSVKGICAEVTEEWKFEAPPGAGDLYYSSVSGSKATLVVEQDSAHGYLPELYLQSAANGPGPWKAAVVNAIAGMQKDFPGIGLEEEAGKWRVTIPDIFRTGHESQFSQVARQYFEYIHKGTMPAWEISFMLAKYFITTGSLKKAMQK